MSSQLEELRAALAGRYTIERELGSGGMGTVYRVHDAERNETVALKTLRWTDPAAVYRFKQEFRALGDVAHGNLVQLHQLVAQGDVWFFTMELIEGRDFLEHVRPGHGARAARPAPTGAGARAPAPVAPGAGGLPAPASGGVLDLPRLRAALRQLIRGVVALHAAGIVHRDLKPGNVLVDDDGRVVILDFGIAAEVVSSASAVTAEDGISGTIEYMSPEQCAGERCTPASDWYAVGVLLYEALTGRLPFAASGMKLILEKMAGDPPPPDALVPDLPADLVALCVSLLARAPAARPTDAELRVRLRLSEASVVVDRSGRQAEGAPLVGRARHLDQLHDALAAAERGQPVSVCVYGPSGIGKTTLVRRFTDDLAGAERATVLAGRCFVRETVPYKALDGVIDMLTRLLRETPGDEVEAGLPPDTTALARVFPVLRRVDAIERRARAATEIADERELRRRAFAALRDMLGAVARQRPVVLHIDDLQWADRDSADVLNELLQTAAGSRLLFVLCFRSENVEGMPFLADLLARASTDRRRTLELGPLATEDAVEYAMQMLGRRRPDAHPRAEVLARESDGNPFLLDQMVRVTMDAVREGDGASLGLGEMLAARLAQMPPGARELAEVLAVAGQPIDAGVAYRAANLEGDERPLVTTLRLAHLVRAGATTEEIDLYHDRIRETLARDLPAARAGVIHRRLAEALEAKGIDDPESLYEHYLGAGEGRRAATFAARAAAGAQAALAFQRAALFYQRALDLGVASGAEQGSWLVGLGDALASAGRGGEAAHAYLAAKPLLDGPAALEIERRAGQQYLVSGRIEEGLEVIGRVLAKVGLPRFAPSPRRALLHLVLRRVRLAIRGLAYTERREDEVPPDQLTRIDTCWAVAEGMGLVDNIQGAAYQTLSLLLALDSGVVSRIGRALAMEAGFAASTGAQERSARLLREAERLADRLGSRTTLGLCRAVSAVSALHGGRFEEAERFAAEAEAILAEQQGAAWPFTLARVYHISALNDAGKVRELCRVSRLFLADALDRGNLFAATMFRTGWSSLVWLGADDLAGARAALAAARAQCPAGVFYIPHYNVLVAQGLVDLYAGDGVAAYRHISEVWPMLERSQVLRVRSVRIRCLRMRAACAIAAANAGGDPGALLAVAERDAGRIERGGRYAATLNRAKAGVLRAGIAVTRGNTGAAIGLLGAAIEGFRTARSALWLAVAGRLKGELVGRAEGRALVAESEAWMAGEEIVNPARLTAAFATGFGSGGAGEALTDSARTGPPPGT